MASSLFKWRFLSRGRPCCLSSFLCRMEAGEEGTESAQGTMGRWKRGRETPAFSLFPPFPARFLYFDDSIAIFIGIPSGSLCGGERGLTAFVTPRSLNSVRSFNRLLEVTTVLSVKPSKDTFKTLLDFLTVYRTLLMMATMNTTNTFALSKWFDFRFLTFGHSSKKISESRAKPRPSKGVSCLLFGVEATVEVVGGGILLRLMSLSCALSKSEADIRGSFSSSGFSENIGNNSRRTYHLHKPSGWKSSA